MLTHAQIWTALDRLAARAGLSPSGLARKAGLDPTTFNRSKRMTPEGRSRWPSTESLAKSLAATGTSMETFVQLIDDPARSSSHGVPMIDFAQAATNSNFDDSGHPAGRIPDRRKGDRHRDLRAVLPLPHGFAMGQVDALLQLRQQMDALIAAMNRR